MDVAEIQKLIPHRPPMLLVDRVISRLDNELVCEKTFRTNEFFLQGHYPDFPIVPGVILCECAAQAGAILLASQLSEVRGVPVLTRMNDVRFKRMVRPGDTITTTVKLDEKISDAWCLNATVRVDRDIALRLSFVCMLTDVR